MSNENTRMSQKINVFIEGNKPTNGELCSRLKHFDKSHSLFVWRIFLFLASILCAVLIQRKTILQACSLTTSLASWNRLCRDWWVCKNMLWEVCHPRGVRTRRDVRGDNKERKYGALSLDNKTCLLCRQFLFKYRQPWSQLGTEPLAWAWRGQRGQTIMLTQPDSVTCWHEPKQQPRRWFPANLATNDENRR